MEKWEIKAINMWNKEGKWNAEEINSVLIDGYEPYAAVTSVYGGGGGSFLGGMVDVDSQPILLFRRKQI